MLEIMYQSKNVPVNKCFEYMSGNCGLSSTFIHNNRNVKGEKYSVLSSSTTNDTLMGEIARIDLPNGKKMKVFEDKEGILIARNGNAGTMTWLKPGKYTINDHAYILYLKDDCPYEINLRWFSFAMKEYMLNFVTTKTGNKTWSVTEFYNKGTIDIPAISIQNKKEKDYTFVYGLLERLNNMYNKIEQFNLSFNMETNMKEFDLLYLFSPKQGNALYTRKNIFDNKWEGNIPVIGSSNENEGILEYIDIKYVKPKDYVNSDCITWAVDGNAGKLFIRDKTNTPYGFVFNNHCGVLFPKNERNDVYLPYVVNCLQPIFFDLAKNANNKKLGNNQISEVKIMLPTTADGTLDYQRQKELVKKQEVFSKMKNMVLQEIEKIIRLNVNLEVDYEGNMDNTLQ